MKHLNKPDVIIDINQFIASRAEVANISCRTFLVTIFGDVVSQHGNWIWLGSLIESLEPFGYSERLVRTSVFRLVKEDWLQVKKIGRKSYYSFTESANKHYTKAARRIYATEIQKNQDSWLILLPSFVAENKMPALKRQLKWLGFSSLASGVFTHPKCGLKSLEETIRELDLIDSVVIFSSKTKDSNSLSVLKKLVFEKWDLKSLQDRYQLLIAIYEPIYQQLKTNKKLNPQQSFSLRNLLIHEYRRILLSDHELSERMLPKDWLGQKSNQIVGRLYRLLEKASCRYIITHLQTSDGLLPPPVVEFSQRFKTDN